MAPLIVLFRQDLRLTDNPALSAACQTGQPIIPIYILDNETPGAWKMGGASRWWLHHSLIALQKGIKIHLFKGETVSILKHLIQKYKVSSIYFNRCYEPYALKLEQKLQNLIPCHSFNGSLLFEPWDIMNQQHAPFKVYTPFWRKCMEVQAIENPLPEERKIQTLPIESESLDAWNLLPKQPDWSGGLKKTWTPGEKGAQIKLKHFLDQSLNKYALGRDIPSLGTTSELSPHLHFGEISPRQLFAQIKDQKFLSELGWREFSYYQLYHFPNLPETPWRREFAKFPWETNASLLKKWQKGETGYPIVDAGMRQLWTTGWMHNRVRMIVASFLIKDLFQAWQEGEKWFWDTLVDADLANNSASWQWVAGSGFDAAPFFRIFNPTLQGQKFDPDGIYIKKWVSELKNVPKEHIHTPWKELNISYPKPIVDHNECRKKALEAFKNL